ncbi:rubredoxin [Caballeronia sp. HLA56]
MYKKGAALELQFAPARLNSGAGDPYWIDLTVEEARRLHAELDAYLAADRERGADPLVVTLDRGAADETLKDEQPPAARSHVESEFKQWVCVICGWIYDEATGDPEHGVAAGTRWSDIPDDWRCPLCDVGKEDFALVEF